MSDDEENNFMTGFLFGNISAGGDLEDDGLLDEESRKHIGALSYLGGAEIGVRDLLAENDTDSADPESADTGYATQEDSAVDYSDITELIDDDDENTDTPPSSQLSSFPMDPPPVPNREHPVSANSASDKLSKRLVTPLADMLPPEFKGADVREFFPDFKVGEVLRFSRLFPPHYTLPQYKKKKKSEDSNRPNSKSGKMGSLKPVEMDWGVTPTPDQLAKDEQVTFLEPIAKTEDQVSSSSTDKDTKEGAEETSNSWRYGPAQYWFDVLGVDPDATTYDYGFKKKADGAGENDSAASKVSAAPDYPDDAYLMVCQTQWENDVIWVGEEGKAAATQSAKANAPSAGWIPTPQCRTVEQYCLANKIPNIFDTSNSKKFQSFFPIENDALVYSAWEKDIIWDSENMEEIPTPRGLTLDLNDDNIVYEIPEDKETEQPEELQPQTTTKKEPRKSQLAMQKIGIVKEKEEEDDDDKNSNVRKDPFNISNDEYYNPKLATDSVLRTNVGGNLIQHSTPAVDLKQPFFPTFLGLNKLRHFHRHPLKKYSHGAMSELGPLPVLGLQKQIKRKAKLRDQERQAMGGGEIFFMRTPQDLTACDGDLVLAEYSEEYPPVLMQVGMATKVKNYYKRKPGGDNKPPNLPYGELAYAHHSPFLGNLNPGQTLQAFENNMYRVPIYQHVVPYTDFLVIRTRQHYYIRKVSDVFCVGQLCPLAEIPGPNSKRANIFVRDFLQAFIYRLFWASNDTPRRIKMEDIKRAFQSHSESSIRKRLKLCADFKRTGMDSNWWVMKSEFRLPTHEEIRAMVSPEQCCQFYSLLAAEQRLKDAGYGEKSLFAPEQDEDDEAKIDDEVKTAPWNTSRAYIQALKGKCLLSLTGDTDPTGCGEGFAYVRVPNKPITNKADQKGDTPKKTVTGTNADLRRLNLADAKKLLRDKGFPEAEIKKLSRWEVIDCVRTMSTREAKAGEEGGMTKFARGNRQSVAEHQERYREECQRLFDLQNKILGSSEILSTDEEGSDSGSEDSDYDEMGKNIESMLTNKKSNSQLSKEREEAELKQLQKSLMDPKGKDKLTESASSQELNADGKPLVRKLKITRVFRGDNGEKYSRSEIVTKPMVIEAYLKIRRTQTDEFITSFASMDEVQKEEMKRERRRLQEQLRRIKRNEEKLNQTPSQGASGSPPKKKKKENAKDIKLKCGACQQVGHMRTNKECPLWSGKMAAGVTGGVTGNLPSLNVALTMEEEEDAEKEALPADENLVHVEGTKVVLSKQLLEHADKVKKQTLTLKFPKKFPKKEKEVKRNLKSKRKSSNALHCDYLTRPNKVAHRRRADPSVSICTIFEHIISEMREIPNSQPFHVPVNPRDVPDYFRIVTQPMDLQTLRENVRNRKYENRQQFMSDVHQMYANSKLYNGLKNIYTLTAEKMLELTLQRFAEKEDKLMRLEKAINPLLDDNDIVAFSYVLENIIVNRLKTIDKVSIFTVPVNTKKLKDYAQLISHPMDLQTLLDNVKKHKYHNRDEFLADVELIYTNCSRYNGADSVYTNTALKIFTTAKACVEENDDQMKEWEAGIKAKQEAAMEGLESESVVTGTSIHDDMSNLDEETRTGDYTIVEDGTTNMLDSSAGASAQSQPVMEENTEESSFVEVLDDSITVPMDTDITGEIGEGVVYDQSYYTKSTLDDDLELSGDEQEGATAMSIYKPEIAADEDSQMSFNAEQFFQANFQTTGEIPGEEPAVEGEGVMRPITDVINNDLQLSESDEDEELGDQPGEGVGFDFDDFEDV